MSVKPVPEGYHTLTPYFTVRDAEKAIDFYKKAFGAMERGVMKGPDGKVMHAELMIGDSIVMLNDEFPEMGALGPKSRQGTSVTIHLFVTDADAAFAQAVKAGATVKMPLQDMFWGDRCRTVADADGNTLMIATHVSEPTPAEMKMKMKEQAGAQAVAAATSATA